ncbi:hypothetical protein FACS1894208_06690 [Clostridia bacterium]|nr:hypothetical protein FACS1894208_06690 [Clostridia bacterium]
MYEKLIFTELTFDELFAVDGGLTGEQKNNINAAVGLIGGAAVTVGGIMTFNPVLAAAGAWLAMFGAAAWMGSSVYAATHTPK